jgi:hypothetical protein
LAISAERLSADSILIEPPRFVADAALKCLSEIRGEDLEVPVDRIRMSGAKRFENRFAIGTKFQVGFLEQLVDGLWTPISPMSGDFDYGAEDQRLKSAKKLGPRGFVTGP